MEFIFVLSPPLPVQDIVSRFEEVELAFAEDQEKLFSGLQAQTGESVCMRQPPIPSFSCGARLGLTDVVCFFPLRRCLQGVGEEGGVQHGRHRRHSGGSVATGGHPKRNRYIGDSH